MTLCQWIENSTSRPAQQIAMKYKHRGWQQVTWSQLKEKVDALSAALLDKGAQPGDRAVIFASTRFEWALADLATLGIGCVTVPFYPNLTVDELKSLLRRSRPKFAFIENTSLLRHWRKAAEGLENPPLLITFESTGEIEHDTMLFSDFMEAGASVLPGLETKIRDLRWAVRPEDTATLLFTSGTTGEPRAVVLRHEQIVSEVTEAFRLCGVTDQDVSLSFLPYAHILGRIDLWGSLFCGYTLCFAESIEKIRDNLTTVQPTILVAVPRIFEKIQTAILGKLESSPLQRKLFNWALDQGRGMARHRTKRESVPLWELPTYFLADQLVLSEVRAAFGGRLRFAICGGAPLSKEICEFFYACGILLLEGYGLSETTGAVCVNTPFDYEFGTVGLPIGDVEIKIADDGEVLVRSKKVMKEYEGDPEATRQVLSSDGWFSTGDLGELNDGKLKITGRKKDLIKTAGGKYVAPQKLEALLRDHPLVSQVHIHGDQRKYVVALLTIDNAFATQWARQRNLPGDSLHQWMEHASFQQEVRSWVAEVNERLASYESIKRYKILQREFSIETGELTQSLKVKRKVVDQKFADEIEALYR